MTNFKKTGKMNKLFKALFIKLLVMTGVCVVLSNYAAAAQTNLPEPFIKFTFEDAKSPPLKVEAGGEPKFVDGFKGKALVVFGQAIYWDCTDSNFNWEQGTISFWYMPVDWKEKGRIRYWLITDSEPDKSYLRIVHVGGSDTAVPASLCLQIYDIKNQPTHLWNAVESGVNGTWYFVTITWKNSAAALYLNGKMDPNSHAFSDWPQVSMTQKISKNRLYIGKSLNWVSYPTVETSLMDELEIRAEPLDAEQVRLLYYQQKSAVKKK